MKRCPFCGNKPLVGKGSQYKKDHDWLGIEQHRAGEWCWRPAIGCGKCGFRREFGSVEAASDWWNNRVTDERP